MEKNLTSASLLSVSCATKILCLHFVTRLHSTGSRLQQLRSIPLSAAKLLFNLPAMAISSAYAHLHQHT